jgi:hypothetical protein
LPLYSIHSGEPRSVTAVSKKSYTDFWGIFPDAFFYTKKQIGELGKGLRLTLKEADMEGALGETSWQT